MVESDPSRQLLAAVPRQGKHPSDVTSGDFLSYNYYIMDYVIYTYMFIYICLYIYVYIYFLTEFIIYSLLFVSWRQVGFGGILARKTFV